LTFKSLLSTVSSINLLWTLQEGISLFLTSTAVLSQSQCTLPGFVASSGCVCLPSWAGNALGKESILDLVFALSLLRKHCPTYHIFSVNVYGVTQSWIKIHSGCPQRVCSLARNRTHLALQAVPRDMVPQ
jgi:hypothetical protein